MGIDWKKAVAATVPIIRSFIGRGVVPTVRTVYYALVSKEFIPNTRSAYQGLCKKLVQARKDGLVKWNWIADETRATRGSDDTLWEPEEYAEAWVNHLFKMLDKFTLPRWLDQPYYVEVWIEKFALAATFMNWVGEMNVVLVPSRGYSSWTFLKEAAVRFLKNAGDKESVILYFGDFDPSGKDIERFIGEALEWFGVNVEIKAVAVSKEQIDKYDLPSTPEDAEERAKLRRDPRFKGWEHGMFRVELDALMAFVPDEFERIIKEAVSEYFDEETYNKVLEQQEEEQLTVWDRAKDLIDEKMREIREKEDEEDA